jgi:Zinc knuckle
MGGKSCYSCGGFGHLSRECPSQGQGQGQSQGGERSSGGQKCYNCGVSHRYKHDDIQYVTTIHTSHIEHWSLLPRLRSASSTQGLLQVPADWPHLQRLPRSRSIEQDEEYRLILFSARNMFVVAYFDVYFQYHPCHIVVVHLQKDKITPMTEANYNRYDRTYESGSRLKITFLFRYPIFSPLHRFL